jgi:hypothetical protein
LSSRLLRCQNNRLDVSKNGRRRDSESSDTVRLLRLGVERQQCYHDAPVLGSGLRIRSERGSRPWMITDNPLPRWRPLETRVSSRNGAVRS